MPSSASARGPTTFRLIALTSIAALLFLSASRSRGGSLPRRTLSYSILHSFQRVEGGPSAPLITDGRGLLYGTLSWGGPADGGCVFSIQTDGTGFRILHVFLGGAEDGFDPEGALVLDADDVLYGTTSGGGPTNSGAVYSLRRDGGDFRILHFFGGGTTDGGAPTSSLTPDGRGNLYGTTSSGGSSWRGTVFRIGTDGTGYRILHSFAGGVADGSSPVFPLYLDGEGILFGTTTHGGQLEGPRWFGQGTVFTLRTDGTGFRILHAFGLQSSDGAYPSGGLTADAGGGLFGLTSSSASAWGGTAYRIGKDGSAYRVVRSFADSGLNPIGSPTFDQSGRLYGISRESRPSLFRMQSDGSGFEVLRAFDPDKEGTQSPGSLLFLPPDLLFGTMTTGGPSRSGSIFRFDTDGGSFQLLRAFEASPGDGSGPSGLVTDGSGSLYGTSGGGALSQGFVYGIGTDGGGFRVLHTFSGGPDDGASPNAPLVRDRFGNFYGTTFSGGASDRGTIFRLASDGSGFRLLHSFGGADDGANPGSALVLDESGILYGTTPSGGPSGGGAIFRIATDGSAFGLLRAFESSPDGTAPRSLLLDGAGILYGTASSAWTPGFVFRLRTDGTAYSVLHAFGGGPADGSAPFGALVTDGRGTLFGTTAGGGAYGWGTLFRIGIEGSGYRVLRDFAGDGKDGGWPLVALSTDGNLYGTTQGSFGTGAIFTIRPDGTNFEVLHSFGDDPRDGGYSYSAPLLAGPGVLYGTTVSGGSAGFGSIYALTFGWPHELPAAPYRPVRRP